MRKKIKLYSALFLASTAISATAIRINATDFTTTVTYNAKSPEEKNTYEIIIPSTLEVDENGGQMKVTIADGYSFEDDYKVGVSIESSTWEKYTTGSGINEKSEYKFKMYLDGNKDSYYFLQLDLKDSSGEILYPTSSRIVTFCKDGIYNESKKDGTLILTRNSASSDKRNLNGGTYTGTITFRISGSYD